MSHFLEISIRDALIARDGRPFGNTQGHRMRSLDWLYPSVAAGAVRTLLGEKSGAGFTAKTISLLKQIEVAGPLPMADSQLLFPAPQDIAVQELHREGTKERIAWAARPHKMHAGEGTNLPLYLLPVLLPPSAPDFKPARVPSFWSATKMIQWLLNSSGVGFEPPPDPSHCSPEALLRLGYLQIEKDERFHVNIEPGTYAARETQLFMTVALAVPDDVKIALRVEAVQGFESHLKDLNEWTAMGGERRLVCISATGHEKSWACPESIREALGKTNLVRMVLSSPALFKDGWKPGWIRENGKGELGGVKLQLIGASVQRWKPISGWNYEAPRGPKPALRLTPAGSVFFFQAEGSASLLADYWLKSVSDFSDDEQTKRDGFGLALWGPWAPHSP